MRTKKLEEIKKVMDEIQKKNPSFKIIYINKTAWENILTRETQTIEDLFFLAAKDSADKPICINSIEYEGKTYKIHNNINHANLCACEWYGYGRIRIYGQKFCSPITMHHFHTQKNIDKILKGQLMGQNLDSPYQIVRDIVIEGTDSVLRNHAAKVIKKDANPIELLLKQLGEELVEHSNEIKIPEEHQIAVKYKNLDHYTIIEKTAYNAGKRKISSYYPVLTREECLEALNNIPKEEIDMTVIGLGSAGTGILDQVARSTYIKKYFLIDFDFIEKKNLRNQWYRDNDIYNPKTEKSHTILKSINPALKIKVYGKNFQTVNFEHRKTKYIVSGLDNLEGRLELLTKITDGEIEAEYLIDLRYLDTACSIYFINLKDEKQVEYYRKLLLKDSELLEKNKKYIETREDFINFWDSKKYFQLGCRDACERYFGKAQGCVCPCKSIECVTHLYKQYIESGQKIEIEEESSCLRQNFIDIYKYASSFVFAAIREIENGREKPFTHIEAQTEVIPKSMVIR